MTGNPECRLCELGGTALRTCIPTTGYSCVWPRSSSQALLVVAQSPGYEEDRVGRNLVGASGKVLQNVYLGGEIPSLADIYFANTVRCYVQSGATIKPAWVKACRAYLEEDLIPLTAQYEKVTILCLGAVAAKAIMGGSLKDAMSHQGAGSPIGEITSSTCRSYETFSTFHPAYIMYREGEDRKGCKPQYINAIGAHMTLLRAHLEGRDVRSSWTRETPVPYLEPPDASLI